MPRIAIVLRSYNEEALIGRCLDAVFSQDVDGYEVLLVDSESTDRTLEIAARYKNLRLISIRKADFTYGGALNTGFAAASSDTEIAVALSAHAIPTSSSWLDALVTPLLEDPTVAGCYGKQEPVPEHLSNAIVRELARLDYQQCYGDRAFVTRASSFFSNANSAVRYQCWKDTPFDDRIVYAEDAMWAHDVIARGWSIAYTPRACVLHSHPDSLRQFFRRCRNEARGSLVMQVEHAGATTLQTYASEMLKLGCTAAREMARGGDSVRTALDALIVRGTVSTASYVERRRATRVKHQ